MAQFLKNDIMSLTGEHPKYDLAESVGPDLNLSDLLDDSGQTELSQLLLSYGTPAGNLALRSKLAELHDVEPDDVVITVGGMHALFLLSFILCDPKAEAVTTTPLFPLARSALDCVGASVRELRLSFDSGYRIDLADLESKLTPDTKLISLATPQNPVGVAIPEQTIRKVVELMEAKSPDAYLVLDVTYREATYGDDAAAPSYLDLSPKIVSCASLSKCHGAPGLRLGWAITRDKRLREQLVLGKFNTVICCSPVDEFLALKVLEQRERIIGQRRSLLAEGLVRCTAWVEGNADFVEWIRPDAGAFCCVRLKPALFSDAGVERFYREAARLGTRVASGAWFGEEARVFRLGFGLLPMEELSQGLDCLTQALRRASRAADENAAA